MKQMSFWRILLILVAVFYLASCKKNDNDGYNSLILGQWHFSSGSACWLIGDSVKIYDQILTFNPAGNYSEENIWANREEKYVGNWSINDSKIIINDWEGKPLENPVKIVNLSDNRLEISYLNATAVYLRVGTEFENLNERILGRWYYEFASASSKPMSSYEFKNDGTARHRSYYTETIYTEGEYEWNLANDTLSITTLPVRYKTDKYPVRFCNDQYMYWKGFGYNTTTFLSRNQE